MGYIQFIVDGSVKYSEGPYGDSADLSNINVPSYGVPPKDGYADIGWEPTWAEVKKNCSTFDEAAEQYGDGTNIHLVAVYKKLYTLTWNAGNGYFGNDTSDKERKTEGYIGQAMPYPEDPKPNPPASLNTKAGYYEFGGWRNCPDTVPVGGGSYTAYYNKVNYEVILIVDGSVYDTIYATAGTTTSLPTLSSSAGKDFKGWYTSNSGGTQVTSVKLTEAGETVTYYARFEPVTCGVSFEYRDSADSWTSIGPYYHQYGSIISSAPITPPKILGYIHTGWKPSLPYTVDDTQVLISATYDAVAVYLVTFSVNGTIVKSEEVNKGDSATPPDLSEFEHLIPEGSSFEGWEQDYTNIQSYLAVTAKLSSNYHTVTYYYLTESGNSTYATQSVKHGDSPSGLTPSIPTGYEFSGWYTSPTGGNKVNLAEQKITSDTFYYAQYSIKTYTVIFKGINGSTTLQTNQNVEHGSSVVPPDFPNVIGYENPRWDSDDYKNVTSDLTITALYDKRSYTVTFVDHDGSVLKTQSVLYEGSAAAPNDPSRTGYTFIGWDTDFSNVKSNLTVTAQYEIITYTMTWNLNGGTIPGMGSGPFETEVDYGDLILAPGTPSKAGYSFDGWKSTEYGTLNGDIATEDGTFTAQYTPIISTADYKIEHYIQNTDGTGYSLHSSSPGSDTVGATVTAYPISITGFTAQSGSVSGTVVSDGSLILKLYYSRNKYTITFMNEGKVFHSQDYYYEAMPIAPSTTPTKEASSDGTKVYLFNKWTPDFVKVTGKATYTASYITVPQFVWTCGGVDDEENLINGPNKVAGLRIYVTADEWNSLVNFINNSGVTLESASVSKGDKISASVVNLVATKVGVESVTQKTRITAAFFNLLREKANALRLAFEKSKKE